MALIDWGKLEKLRAPASLASALYNLNIKQLFLVRRELRTESDQPWIWIPHWLKERSEFENTINKDPKYSEIFENQKQEIIESCFRAQEVMMTTDVLGLGWIIVPLVLRNERIGFLVAGGLVLESETELQLHKRWQKCGIAESAFQVLTDLLKKLPLIEDDKRDVVKQMLSLIAKELIVYFEETTVAKERDEVLQRNTFSQWVTTNPLLKQILQKIPAIAQSDSTVLIYGEPGTGRELLAEMIHHQGKRADAAIRTLECSSVTENLFEAELLGYEQGAFAGALQTKRGIVEECKGGTLYLKEIGDLSLPMQLKILRLIQDQTYTRLGSSQILKSDVRIVASTQRNLKRLVQMGAFREDLYFKLSVLELELPPLRARRQDINLLSEYFLKRFMKKMNKEGLQWTEQALQKLSSHSFPGNVQELQNEVERLVALKEPHSMIEIKDLSVKIVESVTPMEEIEKGRPLKDLVDDYERVIIAETLTKYHWNKSKVAELFQITRQGLMKKIAKYALDKRRG